MKKNVISAPKLKQICKKIKNALFSKEIFPRILMVVFISVAAVGVGIWVGEKDQISEQSASSEVMDYSTISNKSSGWGLKKVKNSEPEVTETQKSDLAEYNAFYMDNSRPKKLYLTFDEGYENGYTEQMLDTLKEKNVKAIFFCTYDYVRDNPEIVQRMIDEGHIVGNHSYSHYNMTEIDLATAKEEITLMHDYVKDNFDYDMKYFRFPSGEFSEQTLALAADVGYKSIFWSFAYEDWNADNPPDETQAFEKITSSTHNGAILLLHAVSSTNANILGDVIDEIQNQGYTFTTEL